MGKNDGKDTTTNNEQEGIEFVETVKTKVNDKDVVVNYDEDGNLYVNEEDVPEGMKPEELEEQLRKSDPKVGELGNTLSNLKKARTEQNEKISGYDELSRKNTEYKSELQKLKDEITVLKESKQAVEASGKSYAEIYEEKFKKELGIDDGEDIEDYVGTKKYHTANVKAQEYAIREFSKQQNVQVQQSLGVQSKVNELSVMVRTDSSYEATPDKVWSFAQTKKITHWSPSEIYTYFKSTHPQHNIVDKVNNIERKKKGSIKIIPKTSRSPKKGEKDEYSKTIADTVGML